MTLENKRALLAALFFIAAGCSHTPAADDPLANTKKLVASGHGSLYNNGAFQIPTTEIMLIPPGPSALDLALELAGVRARASLTLALKHARDSVYVVTDETKSVFHFAGKFKSGGKRLAKEITGWSRPHGILLVEKSVGDSAGILGWTWQAMRDSAEGVSTAGRRLEEDARQKADDLDAAGSKESIAQLQNSARFTHDLSKEGADAGKARLNEARDDIVIGYATRVPDQLRTYRNAITQNPTLESFQKNLAGNQNWRAENSNRFKTLVAKTGKSYFSEVRGSFQNAGDEFSSKLSAEGLSFASLRAARWVLQGIFWDALIAPAGKLTYGGIGYLTTNGLAFPVMVVAEESAATMQLAVETLWNGSKMTYSFVAPTGQAAVAGLLGVAEIVGRKAGAAAVGVGGAVASGGTFLLTKTASLGVRGGGVLMGRTVQYVGVPLSVAGIAVAGGAGSVVYGTAEAAGGVGLTATAEVAGAGTAAGSALTAGAIAAGGATLSAAKGGTVAVYELSRAVVVPTGYELGSGVVLGYSTLSHFAAHTILAAADFSYMVLSLEGPHWVLYAVRGKLNDGSQLAPGTVLDLNKLKDSGEEIYKIPVPNDEMKPVLEHLDQDLPPSKL